MFRLDEQVRFLVVLRRHRRRSVSVDAQPVDQRRPRTVALRLRGFFVYALHETVQLGIAERHFSGALRRGQSALTGIVGGHVQGGVVVVARELCGRGFLRVDGCFELRMDVLGRIEQDDVQFRCEQTEKYYSGGQAQADG